MKLLTLFAAASALALGACGTPLAVSPIPSKPAPLACNDGIKSAFKPDALTTVVAVQAFGKGDKVFVSDSPTPVTLAADLCLVKLKVGPGNPGPVDARCTSEGIGIEV